MPKHSAEQDSKTERRVVGYGRKYDPSDTVTNNTGKEVTVIQKPSTERVPVKVRKLGDLTGPISALANDVVLAEEDMDANPDGYHRRNYVRALFAMIEGSIYMLKQTALSAALRGKVPLAPEEYALMSEQTFDLDSRGRPRSQTKFLQLAGNVRFTAECVNRVFGAQVAIDVEGRSWSDFKEAIDIRNRITHPKGMADIEVSEQDVQLCKRVSDEWFNELVYSLVQSIVNTVTSTGELRPHNHTET